MHFVLAPLWVWPLPPLPGLRSKAHAASSDGQRQKTVQGREGEQKQSWHQARWAKPGLSPHSGKQGRAARATRTRAMPAALFFTLLFNLGELGPRLGWWQMHFGVCSRLVTVAASLAITADLAPVCRPVTKHCHGWCTASVLRFCSIPFHTKAAHRKPRSHPNCFLPTCAKTVNRSQVCGIGLPKLTRIWPTALVLAEVVCGHGRYWLIQGQVARSCHWLACSQ